MKNILITLLLVALLGLGAYTFMNQRPEATAHNSEPVATTSPATTTPEVRGPQTVIGRSAGGKDIVAYHFGSGDKEILFVGGIHGGYEWNTVMLAYQFIDALKADPTLVPAETTITVVPVLNPDGLQTVVGTTSRFSASDVPSSQEVQIAGRSNGSGVDLNRNFDCDWKASGVWQNNPVSGGSKPFSEPESQALQQYQAQHAIAGAVFWFSAAGGVYSASCGGAVSSATKALTEAYAKASGYPAHQDFTSYAVTGDATNWLARMGIPTISVLLTNHTDTEWQKNLKGIKAALTELTR